MIYTPLFSQYIYLTLQVTTSVYEFITKLGQYIVVDKVLQHFLVGCFSEIGIQDLY